MIIKDEIEIRILQCENKHLFLLTSHRESYSFLSYQHFLSIKILFQDFTIFFSIFNVYVGLSNEDIDDY